METLLSEVSGYLLEFIDHKTKEDEKKFRIPSKYSLVHTHQNLDVVTDAVRLLVFKGGMTQYSCDDDVRNMDFEAFSGEFFLVNFVLLPLPFPLSTYQDICRVSAVLVEIAEELSVNLGLLNEIFTPLVKYDKFVRDLLSISNEVYGPGGRRIEEDIRTHVIRSDFFIHLEEMSSDKSEETEFCRFCHYDHCLCDYGRNSKGDKRLAIKLVEMNLGAASVSYHSGNVHRMHNKVLKTNVVELNENKLDRSNLDSEIEKLHPKNDPDSSFTYPVAESHNLYLNRYTPIFGKRRVCVFNVTRNGLHNYYDTYFLSNDLFEKYGIYVKTVCPNQMIKWMKNKNMFLASEWEYNADGSVNFTKYTQHGVKLRPGRLVLNLGEPPSDFKNFKTKECFEVSVIHYRDFFDSALMESEDRVELRKLIEFGDCVKIPTSLIQLANSKRSQLYFSNPENVDRLIESYNKRVKGVKRNEGATEMTKETAILQVDPSLESSEEVVRDAIKNPQNYILKSNREAGSSCTYGKEISQKLEEGLKNKDELCQYVLMKKIKTPRQPALFVKHLEGGSFEFKGNNSLTEFGVYHHAVYDGNECKVNDNCGYLARTKPDYAEGGGIAAGYGFVNSLLFF